MARPTMAPLVVSFGLVSLYREYLVSVLISSLPGNALRMLVDIASLSSDSTCVLKAESGKLDIKRREPGIVFYPFQADLLLKLAIVT